MNYIFSSKILDDPINRRFKSMPLHIRRSNIAALRRDLTDSIISGEFNPPNEHLPQETSVICVASSWNYVHHVSQWYNIQSLYIRGEAASEFGSYQSAIVCQNLRNLAYLGIHQDSGVALSQYWNRIYLPYLRTLDLSRDDSSAFTLSMSQQLYDWNMYPMLTNISMPIEYISVQALRSIPTTLRYIDITGVEAISQLHQDAIEISLSRQFSDLHTLMLPGVTKRSFLKIANIDTLIQLEVIMAEETHQFPVGHLQNLEVLSLTTDYGFADNSLPQSFIYLPNLRTLEIISPSYVRYPEKFHYMPNLNTLIISLIDSDIPQSISKCRELEQLDILGVSIDSLRRYDVRRLPKNTQIVSPRYDTSKELQDALNDPIIQSHRMIYDTLANLFNEEHEINSET